MLYEITKSNETSNIKYFREIWDYMLQRKIMLESISFLGIVLNDIFNAWD